MKKIDYKAEYNKALKVGLDMLEHAKKLDDMADKNPDLEKAIQQRCLATLFRDYYTRMFN